MNLQPVSDALLSDARREAAQLLASADEDAAAAVRAAREEAERLCREASAEGRAEARAVAAAELARSRREARELVLAAQREAYELVRAESRRAASELRRAAGYDGLVDGLVRLARAQLGGDATDATVTVDEDVGGIVARRGSRSVDYRLPAIVDRVLASIGPAVERLWR